MQSLSDVQWQRFSWLKKSSKLILLMILSGPKLYRKLEFQFRVLTFPLSCLRKTQISLQISESPLSRHAECYCPIFEPSMLIFEVRGARAVRSGCNYSDTFSLYHFFQGIFFWYLLFSAGCLLLLVSFKILFFCYCLPKTVGLEGLPNLLLLELEGFADLERILVQMCFLCDNLA